MPPNGHVAQESKEFACFELWQHDVIRIVVRLQSWSFQRGAEEDGPLRRHATARAGEGMGRVRHRAKKSGGEVRVGRVLPTPRRS